MFTIHFSISFISWACGVVSKTSGAWVRSTSQAAGKRTRHASPSDCAISLRSSGTNSWRCIAMHSNVFESSIASQFSVYQSGVFGELAWIHRNFPAAWNNSDNWQHGWQVTFSDKPFCQYIGGLQKVFFCNTNFSAFSSPGDIQNVIPQITSSGKTCPRLSGPEPGSQQKLLQLVGSELSKWECCRQLINERLAYGPNSKAVSCSTPLSQSQGCCNPGFDW